MARASIESMLDRSNVVDMGRVPKLTPMDPETFSQTVNFECTQSVQWIEDQISSARMKTELYYQGGTVLKAEKGRSQVVVSTVRDAIHAILPALGRIFTQTDTVGEFSSDDEEDEAICRQMTIYVNNVFNRYKGYTALIQASTNALKSRIGVVRVFLTRTPVLTHSTTKLMTNDDLDELAEDIQLGVVEITEQSPAGEAEGMEMPEMGGMEMPEMAPMMAQNVTLTRTSYRNKWEITAVPPETFIIDSSATSIEDARLVGIRQNLFIWQAMDSLGLKYEDLEPLTQDNSTMLEQERFQRLRYDYNDYNDTWANDPTAKRVLITECWMRIDMDGDGKTELRHLICGGINYDVLVNEVANFIPLAVFLTDLQPNVFFPIALAEDLIQDQDALTSVTRSILDNLALTNQPRTEVNENVVNLEDVKNTEIGAIIRVQTVGQINELVTPFAAGQTLPVLEYLHQNSEARSGVTKLSQGIDPNALQATSRIASNAAVQGADSRIEMMARNLAETGVRELFTAILRTAMYELRSEQSIKTPTGYKKVNPQFWHDQVNIDLNVGLGNGRIDEKQAALQNILQVQQAVIAQAGLINPMVGWPNVRNTLKQMLRLSGIRNVGDYFPPVNPEELAAYDQQKQQQAAEAAKGQQPAAPDLVGAAKVKAESDIQVNQAKIMAQQQSDMAKMQQQQQETIATMRQKQELDMANLKAELMSKITIAGMQTDQKRDAANQQYAVDAYKVQLDDATARAVAVENATNDVT